MLPATRQRWHSRPYPSRSWYSIKRPRRDARLSWPQVLVHVALFIATIHCMFGLMHRHHVSKISHFSCNLNKHCRILIISGENWHNYSKGFFSHGRFLGHSVYMHSIPLYISWPDLASWAWASAHRGKWGQLTPLEKWMKNWKAKTCKKRAVFYVYVIFWEQSGQAGVENGAMLTTYLFRYTSECSIS